MLLYPLSLRFKSSQTCLPRELLMNFLLSIIQFTSSSSSSKKDDHRRIVSGIFFPDKSLWIYWKVEMKIFESKLIFHKFIFHASFHSTFWSSLLYKEIKLHEWVNVLTCLLSRFIFFLRIILTWNGTIL